MQSVVLVQGVHKPHPTRSTRKVRPGAQRGNLPDIQGPLLTGSERPRPRTHAAVHHLFSQVMYLGFKATVLCQGDKGKDGKRMNPRSSLGQHTRGHKARRLSFKAAGRWNLCFDKQSPSPRLRKTDQPPPPKGKKTPRKKCCIWACQMETAFICFNISLIFKK